MINFSSQLYLPNFSFPNIPHIAYFPFNPQECYLADAPAYANPLKGSHNPSSVDH